MPRILCLHGQGTSATIFKSQTAAFRAKLGAGYTFEFVDAPFTCPASPGIQAFYRTATYTWWPEQTVEAVRASHDWLEAYARDHGPFDAVCCFSQGCSLTSSLALYHAAAAGGGNRSRPLPFRAAIFICGGVPLPCLEDLGLEVSPRAHEMSRQTSAQLHVTTNKLTQLAANPELIRRGVGLWDDPEAIAKLLHDPTKLPQAHDVFGLDFTSFPPGAPRISIPTAHIYGAKDPRWPASLQLTHFCDDKVVFDHGGGHDIPRSTEVSNRIADMVRQVTRGL